MSEEQVANLKFLQKMFLVLQMACVLLVIKGIIPQIAGVMMYFFFGCNLGCLFKIMMSKKP
jgi:hypothetical protein